MQDAFNNIQAGRLSHVFGAFLPQFDVSKDLWVGLQHEQAQGVRLEQFLFDWHISYQSKSSHSKSFHCEDHGRDHFDIALLPFAYSFTPLHRTCQKIICLM